MYENGTMKPVEIVLGEVGRMRERDRDVPNQNTLQADM
jgi:hypothetical protein